MKSLRFSLRYLSKARGNNFSRIVSLTLGLAVSLLIFSYVSFLLSFDRSFKDHDRIYQVWALYGLNGIGLSSQLHAPLAPSMKQDMPQIECATRTTGVYRYDMQVAESTFPVAFWGVDTSFCDVFGVEFVSGSDPHTIFAVKDQIAISQSLAQAAFPGKDPIGEKIKVNNQLDFFIAGVFKDLPINTSLGSFNMLASFDYLTEVGMLKTGWGGGDSFQTYLKLNPDAQIAQVEAQMPAFIDKYNQREYMDQWKMEYIFNPIAKSSFMLGNNLSMIRLLSALAFLLLFVATMNYVLVSISGLVQRSRTIALLKCNGAHKTDIFRIFLAETLLLLVVSLVLATLLLLAFSKPIAELTSYPMSQLFAWQRIWTPATVLLVSFLLAGLLPARLFTKVPIEAAFKGISDNRRRWKQVLLGVEIACITCVLSLLWITTLQIRQLSEGDFGYDQHNLLTTMLMGRPSQFEQYVTELEALPEVESVGHAYHLPIYGYSGMPCVDEISRDLLFSCRWEAMDRHYLNVMKMEIVEGNNFTEESLPTDVVVNQEYVRLREWTDSPIGHQIRDMQGEEVPLYTIVGVVKDFRMESDGEIQPIVLHNASIRMETEAMMYGGIRTMIRLHQMSPESIAAVTEKLKTYESANNNLVSVYTDLLSNQLTSLRSLRNLIGVGSIITLIIALIGLVGYLSDECNRRNKEIAIRKVNGATVGDILQLLYRNTLTMLVISVVGGVASAYYAAGKILQQFSTRVPLSWWIFVGSAAAVALTVYLIQLYKTWHTANSNPAVMIQSE